MKMLSMGGFETEEGLLENIGHMSISAFRLALETC